jgi:hypothetical protein
MANISFRRDSSYLRSPSIRTPSLLKKSLSISKYLYPFKRVSTLIRRNLFTKDDGNFTADLQNVSLVSLDENMLLFGLFFRKWGLKRL